jgi:hypothetical protein
MKKDNELYETTDLAFASFLVASGHEYLMDTKESHYLKRTFGFVKGPELVVRIRSPPTFPLFFRSGGGSTPARKGVLQNPDATWKV